MADNKTRSNKIMRQALGLSPQRLGALSRAVPKLHAWYETTARDLPWRRTRDPYAIWISEVMLQQTQVSTVIPYFERWMRTLPTVNHLSRAERPAILRLWEGLGYYSRAMNLHQAACSIMRDHKGVFPRSLETFRSLPGVGPYTAAAVLSIAFDQDLAVVDGNVRRVLSRLVALRDDSRHAPWAGALHDLAQYILPQDTAATHNQAVMELGAVVCSPRSPGCTECCLSGSCAARAAGDPEAFPPRVVKRPIPQHHIAVALVLRRDRLLIAQRPYDGFLGGMWGLPEVRIQQVQQAEQSLREMLRDDFHLQIEVTDALPTVRHAYSHFKVTLHPRICVIRGEGLTAAEETPRRWVRPAELSEVAMPRANRKVLEHLGHLPDPLIF